MSGASNASYRRPSSARCTPETAAAHFPAVSHRKRYVDGHHLKHWIHGGETDSVDQNASREGFCTTVVQSDFERAEVREPAAVYRLTRHRLAVSKPLRGGVAAHGRRAAGDQRGAEGDSCNTPPKPSTANGHRCAPNCRRDPSYLPRHRLSSWRRRRCRPRSPRARRRRATLPPATRAPIRRRAPSCRDRSRC